MDRDVLIRRLWKKKRSQSSIASELGVSLSTVRRRMRVLSLSGFSSGVKSCLDDGFFGVIDCERKAYWLGFLAADGCLAKSAGSRRSIRLFLSVKDECVIRDFIRDISYGGKICFSRNNCGVVFNSIVMSSDLIGHGFLKWKSGDPSGLLGAVPSDLVHHFVRGFFDGDGSIVLGRRNGLISSFLVFTADRSHDLVLRSIEDIICSSVGVSRNGVKFRDTCCVIRWSGNNQIKKIGDWLYSGSTVFLKRKKVRFGSFNVFRFINLQNFRFSIKTDQIDDLDSLCAVFTDIVVRSGWRGPVYDVNDEYGKLGKIDLSSYVVGGKIVNGFPYGNRIVLSFCPKIWMVSRNGPAICNLSQFPNLVGRAVRNFFSVPNRRLYPERFVRELLFAGFSRASLLSVPVIMAVIEKFGLRGRWFDPCAGWGNRLIAAYLLGIDYCGTDPNTVGDLRSLGEWLFSKRSFVFRLFGSRYEDLCWPDFDFLFTSIPFHNKEDYLDGVDYGLFDDWCDKFINGILDRCGDRRVVLHVDRPIRDWIVERFECDVVDLVPLNHHKLSVEFFVEIKRGG